MSLTYPYPDHPAPGELLTVAPGVHWLTMPMGGSSLNHINLYVLDDGDGCFIVDTGLPLKDVQRLWQEFFATELKGRPVKGVICTHMHPDHVGNATLITDQFHCPLYMTRAEYYQSRAFSAGGPGHHSSWQGEQFYQRAGMPQDYLKMLQRMWEKRSDDGFSMPAMPTGYQRLEDGDVLTIGGRDWAVMVGSGHSPEHACLHCKGLGILLSGDQILPVITSNVSVHPTEPDADPLRVWLESHDHFMTLPVDTLVLPAHNLPFYGVRERLRELINHHEDRMLAIEEHCVEPKLAKDLLPVLFKRDLDPRQMMMALGEAIAHLHLLMHRNRIERSLAEDGRYHFLSIDPSLSRRSNPDRHDAPSDSPIMV